MLVDRCSQSTPPKPITPAIAPWQTMAAWKPSLSATCLSVVWMKSSVPWCSCSAAHGIHGVRWSRLASMSRYSPSASATSGSRRWQSSERGKRSTTLRTFAARHEALAAVMAERHVRHVLLRGADRSGTAIGWLTRWPVTREAIAIVTPGEADALLVGFYNHVPNATRIATEADVRYIGEDPAPTPVAELRRRGAAGGR